MTVRWNRIPGWQQRSILLSGLVILLALWSLCLCSPRHLVTQVDQPMTLDRARQMRELSDFPFPPTAHHIYYAGFVDWVRHETLIRFDAPPADCEAALANVIKWYESNRHWTYPTTPISTESQLPDPDRQFFPEVKWWDGYTVKQGLYAGKDSSNMPQVWVDSERGRVYFFESD